MDIAVLSKDSIRIKGKTGSVVVDPTSSTPKTEADIIVVLNPGKEYSDSKIEGSRITIVGPGEYEANEIKVTGTKVDNELVYSMDVDSVKVLVGSGSAIEKISDKLEAIDIALINSSTEFNYSILTTLEPRVIVAYSDKKEELGKSLGKEAISMNKFSTTSDKLPEEMQLVLLG